MEVEDQETLEEVDVREYVPAKRHELIYEKYDELGSGDGFVLLNDHEPKPLYYQPKEEKQGELVWEYLNRGGDEWRVLIGRQAV